MTARRLLAMAALVPVAGLLLVGCSREAAPDEGPRVVVRDTRTALPPGQLAGAESAKRDEPPAEIVILPEDKPQRTTRVIHRVVGDTPSDAPTEKGPEADLTGAGAVLPTPRPGGAESVVLPARGTRIFASASTTLSTDTGKVGDPVSATIDDDIVVDGEVVIPARSRVEGRVSGIDRGEYPTRRPSIELVFDRVVTPDGRTIPIDARSQGEVGTVTQHPRGNHDRMRNILIGAGVGSAAGGVMGGKKGAILGGIAGAATGAGVGHGGVDWCGEVRPGDSVIIILDRDAIVRRGPVIMNAAGR